MAQIAYHIGTARVARGWTYDQLASRAGGGVRGVTVEGIELEARKVQVITLIRIAQALGVRSFDSLLGPMPLDDLDPEP